MQQQSQIPHHPRTANEQRQKSMRAGKPRQHRGAGGRTRRQAPVEQRKADQRDAIIGKNVQGTSPAGHTG